MEEHGELYMQPHMKSFYSQSFNDIMKEAKGFCGDIGKLKIDTLK